MDSFDVFLVLCSLACDTIHGEFSVIRQLMVIDVHLVYIYNVSNGLGLRCLGRQSMAQCSPGVAGSPGCRTVKGVASSTACDKQFRVK